jgi:hypothetical protein
MDGFTCLLMECSPPLPPQQAKASLATLRTLSMAATQSQTLLFILTANSWFYDGGTAFLRFFQNGEGEVSISIGCGYSRHGAENMATTNTTLDL